MTTSSSRSRLASSSPGSTSRSSSPADSRSRSRRPDLVLEGEVATLPPRRAGRAYWQAQGIAELSLARFDTASVRHDEAGRRGAYYLLRNYHRRTLRILRSAIADQREALAQAALRNLVLLHRP